MKEAIVLVDYDYYENRDRMIVFLLGYIKMMGTVPLNAVVSLGESIAEIKGHSLKDILLGDRLFRFYVALYKRNNFSLEELLCVYEDYNYQDIIDYIEEKRKRYKVAGGMKIDLEMFTNIFYYGVDINQPVLKDFYKQVEDNVSLKIVYDTLLEDALFYSGSIRIKQQLEKLSQHHRFDELIDQVMDIMPSGVLNGLSPKQYREYENKKIKRNVKIQREYINQKQAKLKRYNVIL